MENETQSGIDQDSQLIALSSHDRTCLNSVVVGEIISVETILRSKGLRNLVIDFGDETAQAVSLATNLKIGMKTAFAKLGTTLNSGEFVETKEFEGVETSGKICSLYELGLGDTVDEVMELPASYANGTVLSSVVESLSR